MILTNPVIISVIIMTVLCLCKVNVLISIIVSAFAGGLVAGIPFVGSGETAGIIDTLIGGMGGAATTAYSYILIGAIATAIAYTGLTGKLSRALEKKFGKAGKPLVFALAGIACFSQNLVPVHIAFIPLLIPPLLDMMNESKLDRRGVATALTFGLKAPYILIPFGFGSIFQGILRDNMAANGMPLADDFAIWKAMLLPVIGMFIGLLVSVFILFGKPREYKINEKKITAEDDGKFEWKHWAAIISLLMMVVVQVVAEYTGLGYAMPLGATAGIVLMFVLGAVPIKEMDTIMNGGIKMMGFIAFVMLVASGYGQVIRLTGGVPALVEASVGLIGTSKIVGAFVMLIIGLLITMGIGTSFGTIPIVATIYVPLAASIGFSPAATVMLLGVAAALGDAGSPASDSTLGPTSGLNADGQHDHIRDTCIPTFITFNIPLIIFGVIAAQIL